MEIQDFKLERYFAQYEFSAKYMFSSSDCDGFSLEYILSIITPEERKIWDEMKFGYTESAGSLFLREEICRHYNNISCNNIVVSSPGELSFCTMNVLLDSSDHIIVISPSYQSLYQVVKSIGCDISFWKPLDDLWSYDVNELEKLILPNTKMIVINFPHNPTGAVLSAAELAKVVEIARRNDLWLYSDEMYAKLVISEPFEEIPPVCDLYEKGISLWGMAKSFALAGLRIGWVASQNLEYLSKLVSFKDYLSICSSTSSEVLAFFALRHSEELIAQNIAKIRKNLALFSKFASESPIFLPFTSPKGGSVAFVPLNTDCSSLEFSDELVESTGILTIPAEMFEYEGKYLRIGFGRECMKDCIEILENKYKK